MKLLLIQSHVGPDGWAPVYPLGLAYIGEAARRRGHKVLLADLNVMMDGWAGLDRLIQDERPECVGISLRNVDNQIRVRLTYSYLYFQETLRRTRAAAADIPIIVGGSGFSMFAGDVMTQNPEITAGVYLEAEESFPELLDHLDSPEVVPGVYYRRNGKVLFSGPRPLPDFGALPFPRRDLSDISPYLRAPFSLGIQTKRGCPLRCAYCSYPHLNGSKYRLRAPAQIADEIEYLEKTLGARNFWFADSVFNQPRDYSEEILGEIIRRDLKIRWNAYLHIDGIDRETVDLHRRAGCVFMMFSPDGISQAALDGLDKDISANQVKTVFGLFRRQRTWRDLDVGFCFFLNPPGETLAGLTRTIVFFFRATFSRLRRGTARIRVCPGWIRLEPHTKIYNRALAERPGLKAVSLLPEDARGLKKTFYRHPRLAWTNPPLLFCFRLLHLISRSARKNRRFRSRCRPPIIPEEVKKF